MGDIGEAKLNKIDKIQERGIDKIKENRILSISGGGIKGIAQLCVIKAILDKVNELKDPNMPKLHISDVFDTIAGTSVGGLIAILLTIPKEPGSKEPRYSPEEALQIFKDNAAEIFPQKWYHIGPFGNIFSHKYSQKPLKKMLEEYAGNSTLDDSLCRLIIPVFDVSGQTYDPNKIFDSHAPNSSVVKKKEVALATAAAPTYFKPVVNKEGVGGFGYDAEVPYAFVDGGLSANRPAASALKVLKEGLTIDQQLEMLKHTLVCSINFVPTSTTKEIPSPAFDGQIGWAVKGKIVNKILKAGEKSSTDEVEKDIDEFIHLSIPISEEHKSLDNSSKANIAGLEALAKKFVENNSPLIENLAVKLLAHYNDKHNLEENKELDVVISDGEDEGYKSDEDESDSVISNRFDMKELSTKLDPVQYEALKKHLNNLNEEQYASMQQAFVKNSNAQEKEVDVNKSHIDNTSVTSKNDDSSTVHNCEISNGCSTKQLLIKDLNDSQYETLQKSLSTLTPRESQLLEMFLQVLDNTQIEALSGRISSIINGNHMDEISELTNSQNMLLNSFSKMFIPDNDYASLSNTCGQEALAQDVSCDGRGSDFSHAPPEVY